MKPGDELGRDDREGRDDARKSAGIVDSSIRQSRAASAFLYNACVVRTGSVPSAFVVATDVARYRRSSGVEAASHATARMHRGRR